MDKFCARITTILVAAYFAVAFFVADVFAIDILYNSYTLLFELCTLLFMFNSGKYHCKYIKWTMVGILLADTCSHIDYYFNIFTVKAHNYIPLCILAVFGSTSLFLSIRHFYKVNKLRNERRKNNIAN